LPSQTIARASSATATPDPTAAGAPAD
jgi:hypothetical protein